MLLKASMWKHILAFFQTRQDMNLQEKKERRLAYLMDFFEYWMPKYAEKEIARTTVGLTVTQEPSTVTLNLVSLRIVVERHFESISAFKAKYNFQPHAKLNQFKVAAFTMYWMSRIKPIHDSRDKPMIAWANEEFSIAVGIGLAGIEINPRTKENRTFLNHLKTGLQTSELSPESIVLILMAMSVQSMVIKIPPSEV